MNSTPSETRCRYEARLAEALDELARSPIPRREHFPWPHRALRRLGVRVRPPHYAPFAANALLLGSVWGAGMATLFAAGGELELVTAPPQDVAAVGLLFAGPFVALWTAVAAWRHHLSPWQELGATSSMPDRRGAGSDAPA